jgi:hypothetical protein
MDRGRERCPIDQTRGGGTARGAVLVAAGLLLFSSNVLQAQQALSRSEEYTIRALPAGAPIIVEGGSGSIRVQGTNRQNIYLQATIQIPGPATQERRNLLEQVRIVITDSGEAVAVRSVMPGRGAEAGRQGTTAIEPSVSYVLNVPEDQWLDLRTGDGLITVTEVGGQARLESTAGDLTVRGITGPLIAGSVNGSITVAGAGAGVEVDTVSGGIFLERIEGRIRATCISGDITIGDSVTREVRASNTGGDISYEGAVVAGGSYVLSSHSGSIRFIIGGEIGFEAQLSTFSGSISTPLEFVLSGSRTSRRSLTGSYLDPQATVTLTAFSGNIIVSRHLNP